MVLILCLVLVLVLVLGFGFGDGFGFGFGFGVWVWVLIFYLKLVSFLIENFSFTRLLLHTRLHTTLVESTQASPSAAGSNTPCSSPL